MTDSERLDTIPGLIAKVVDLRGTRLDVLDQPGEWTARQKQEYESFTEQIDQEIRSITSDDQTFRARLRTVNSLDHQLEALTVWEGFLISTRKRLCDELLSLPRYLRERSEKELQANLEVSIDSVDRGLHSLPGSPVYSLKGTRLGDLMIEAGLIDPSNESLRQFSGLHWQGCTKDVNRERARLTKERDAAEWELDRARATVDQWIAAHAVNA